MEETTVPKDTILGKLTRKIQDTPTIPGTLEIIRSYRKTS